MIRRDVVLSPEATADLLSLYEWITEQASSEAALGYIARLETYVRGFDLASERGTRHDYIRPGLRTVGFERRVTIAFTATSDQVIILGFFYGGRDWRQTLSEH